MNHPGCTLRSHVGLFFPNEEQKQAKHKLANVHYPGEHLQWGAADTEIKVPSVENTELKRGCPFKASVYIAIHATLTHCQRFLPC